MNWKKLFLIFGFVLLAVVLGGLGEVAISKWERLERGSIFVGNLTDSVVEASGFKKHPTGVWLAAEPNSRLVYALNNLHVVQIAVRLEALVNTPITLKAFDLAGREIVRLTPSWQARLDTTPYRFMHTAVFEVNQSVQRIELEASRPGIGISTVQAIRGLKYDWGRFSLIAGVIFIVFLSGYSAASGKISVAEVTLFTALTTGLLLAWYSPLAFTSWDESIHYRNSDKKSLHGIVHQPVRDVFWRAHVLTQSNSIQEQDQINSFFDNQPRGAITQQARANQGSIFDPVFEWYREVGYLPAASGLLIGRFFELPNHEVFRSGRVTNALFYALVIFLAVCCTPLAKTSFAAIGLLPTAVFLSSHYSSDPWIISLSMLGLAIYLRVSTRKLGRASSWELIALVVVPFLAVAPKPIYCLIILLPLLVPIKALGSRKRAIAFKSTVTIAFLFSLSSFLLSFLIEGPGKGDSRGGAGVNATEQVAYVLSNPLFYAHDLSTFLIQYLNPFNMNGLSIDFSGHGYIPGFTLVLSLFVFGYFLDSTIEKSHLELPRNTVVIRSAVILGALCTAALIASALYVAYTPVGSHSINGVQHRYLLPVLPFMMMALLPTVRTSSLSKTHIHKLQAFVPGTIGAITIYGTWIAIVSNHY